MRKIHVLTFVSLDGVMQAPGGPDEDTSGGFTFGGWITPFFDDFIGAEMSRQMRQPFDLLLGRRTFEIFASYWPQHLEDWPGVNESTKYVVSKTLKKHSWKPSVFIRGDIPKEIKKLKSQKGPDLKVYGSSQLIQLLLKNDLVDELWLKIFPVILGRGLRLFEVETKPQTLTLTESKISPKGVILLRYIPAGNVKTGSF